MAGPTASGKSALALDLAERFGGVVINADAMQVYREMRVLTARREPPLPADAGRPRFVGFHMYGSQTPHPWTLVVDEILGGPQVA